MRPSLLQCWKGTTKPDGAAGESIAIGGISGAIAQGSIYPMEVIQTRLAISPAGTYAGILDAFAKIVRQEGYFALFR